MNFPVFLHKQQDFPFPYASDDEGLVAIGGDLSEKRLVDAYSIGLFPWFEHEGLPFWYSPDPRCILYPEKLKVSKSMQALFRKNQFRVSINTDFSSVIQLCANTSRQGQENTWISPAFQEAYQQLHASGVALSVEVWNDRNTLVGGLYGIRLGNAFFGESMFSLEANASKYGFITLVRTLQQQGVVVIDCQQKTDHMISLGAETISRQAFLKIIMLQHKSINT